MLPFGTHVWFGMHRHGCRHECIKTNHTMVLSVIVVFEGYMMFIWVVEGSGLVIYILRQLLVSKWVLCEACTSFKLLKNYQCTARFFILMSMDRG